jgi:hypothetical protein
MSPVRYDLGFYIPEEGTLHSNRRGNLNSYTDNLHVTRYMRFYLRDVSIIDIRNI